jgi:hypothetical protein
VSLGEQFATLCKIVLPISSGSISSERVYKLSCVTLKMKALRCFETSVAVYQSTQRNIPEDLNFQQYRCENLKSHAL